jgi:hypothetical protein
MRHHRRLRPAPGLGLAPRLHDGAAQFGHSGGRDRASATDIGAAPAAVDVGPASLLH